MDEDVETLDSFLENLEIRGTGFCTPPPESKDDES